MYSHFTKKLLTDECIQSIDLPPEWLYLSTSVTGYHDPVVCCGPIEAGMENRGVLAAPLILSTPGWICVFITAEPATQRVGEQRRLGGQ